MAADWRVDPVEVVVAVVVVVAAAAVAVVVAVAALPVLPVVAALAGVPLPAWGCRPASSDMARACCSISSSDCTPTNTYNKGMVSFDFFYP